MRTLARSMLRKALYGFVFTLPIYALPVHAADSSWTVPSDDRIRDILIERIDERQESVGIVIGIITPDRQSVIAYGTMDQDSGAPVGGDTVFEVGSVTKVFTTLLLSELDQRGDISLDGPAGECLPEGVTLPARGEKHITYADLATHTSGLPPVPTNRPRPTAANPDNTYPPEKLYEFLNAYQLPRDIGERYEYSSLGTGLIGHLLGLCAGREFAGLLYDYVTLPLAMHDTGFHVAPEQEARLATGHTASLAPVVRLTAEGPLAGAGVLRSTANDMMKLLSAAMGLTDSPLKPAMDAQLLTRRPTGITGVDIGLGWHIQNAGGLGDLVSHGGTTYGFRAFAGFLPKTGVGVIALSNAATETGVDDIGYHLITGLALSPPPGQAIDAAIKQRYVGEYELAPNIIVTITMEGERLFLQLTNRPQVELLAQSETKFFLKDVGDQVSFVVDGDGPAMFLEIHSGANNFPARRIQ